MAKSWLGWFTRKTEGNWDRRAKSASALASVDASDIDPISGTLHWAAFSAVLDTQQEQSPGALLVIDLADRLPIAKAILDKNSTDILPLLTQSIRQAVRSDDLVTHIHDFKYAVLLRGAAQQMADEVASRICASVDDTLFLTDAGIVSVSVAVGGVVFAPSISGAHELISLAINNLGVARKAGNHVLIQ